MYSLLQEERAEYIMAVHANVLGTAEGALRLQCSWSDAPLSATICPARVV